MPRFYLEGFCDPVHQKREGKSVLWVYTKGKAIRKSAPHNEATRRDFYTRRGPGDIHDTQVEEWLGLIESNAARILRGRALLTGEIVASDREWLALFVGTLFTRTPLGRKILDDISGPAALRIVSGAAKDPGEFRSLLCAVTPAEEMAAIDIEAVRQEVLGGRHSALGRSAEMSLVSVMAVGQKCARLLLDMQWQFVYANETELFLTSDSPVTSVAWEPDGTNQLRVGFAQPGANVYVPLTQDACLRMMNRVEPGTCVIRDRGVRQINRLVMACADKHLYAAERSETLQAAFEKHGCQAPAESFQPKWDRKPL